MLTERAIQGIRLSPQQLRQWSLAARGPLPQNVCAVELAGPISSAELEGALQRVVLCNEILRTNFCSVSGMKLPLQVIRDQCAPSVTVKDVRALSADQQQTELHRLFDEECARGIDVEGASPLNVTLLQIKEEAAVLLLSVPALICDRQGLMNLVSLIASDYSAQLGTGDAANKEITQYADIGETLNECIEGEEFETGRAYWSRHCGQGMPSSLFIDDAAKPGCPRFAPSSAEIRCASSIPIVENALRHRGWSLADFLLACWQVLLYRRNEMSEEIVTGVVFPCRDHELLQGTVGPLSRCLPLVQQMRSTLTLRELLAQTSTCLPGMAQWQHYFSWDHLEPGFGGRFLPYCKWSFEYCELLQSERNSFRIKRMHSIEDRYDARLVVSRNPHDGDNQVECTLHCDNTAFSHEDALSLARQFASLVNNGAVNLDQQVSSISLLSDEERKLLLEDFGRSPLTVANEACIHDLYARQAGRLPDVAALSAPGTKLTHAQLNAQSNQLARYLRKQGVAPDVRVGVCLERSAEMVVAILAILKAGGAYVPLDVSYPRERLAFMADDSQLAILITVEKLAQRMGWNSVRTLCLDVEQKCLSEESTEDIEAGASPDNLAYVIYTSGSTGKPKGVAVTHRALVNHMLWMQSEFDFGQRDHVLQKTPFSFDASVWEFFAPLLNGGELVLLEADGHREPRRLADETSELGVTVVQMVPTLMSSVMQTGGFRSDAQLRLVLCGGETLRVDLARQVWKQTPVELVNLYGPTEATIDSTFWRGREWNKEGSIPIGRPIANARLYVLDQQMELAPIGVSGELYIGGAGLARGYLNHPQLTAEKFVPDPFGSFGERLYRTGDLARWRADSNLEFLGRVDQQVKLHGYRIELGEIESALMELKSIEAATVALRQDDAFGQRLVGYLVQKDGQPVNLEQIRDHLKTRLPEYMVPGAWVEMEALPLTESGKLDRKRLPAPERRRQRTEYVPPRNEKEQLLCRIWEEVLRVERIGIEDNFFEMGGDSILSIQVITRAREAGVQLRARQIFERQSVAELAEVAVTMSGVGATEEAATGRVLLTPIQADYFARELAKPEHYNQSVMLKLKAGVESELLEQALQAVIRQHEVLRAKYRRGEQGWEQWVEEENAAGLYQRKDLSGVEPGEGRRRLEEETAAAQGSLDLERGPVVRVVEYELGAGERRLLLVLHHLVVDGVSWRILLEDVERAYGQLQSGETVRLGAKTTSYKKWAEKLHEYSRDPRLLAEMHYWAADERREAGGRAIDFTEPSLADNLEARQDIVSVLLGEEETRRLLQRVPAVYHTQINDVLLAALALAWRRCGGGNGLIIDMEGHGREEIIGDVDLSRTVGWFTSTFPIYLQASDDWSAERTLKSVKEQLRRVPNRGFGYGVLRYLSEDSEVQQRMAKLPHPEISFNYLGQVDQIFDQSPLFLPAEERAGKVKAGENQRRYVLEVSGMVVEGKLQMSWSYSDKLHRRETIEKLAQQYMEALQELIAHCCSEGSGGYTPSDFPLAGLAQAELDRYIGKGEGIEDIHRLSPMQQGMLFHGLYEPEGEAYFTQMSWRMEGLRVEAFLRAWEAAVRRHAVLRSSFLWEGLGEPVQVVWKQVKVPVAEQDWRGLSGTEQQERWQKFLAEDRKKRFDFRQAPLLRLALMRLTDDAYYFSLSDHHILMDGWSHQILAQDVFRFYEAFSQGRSVELKKAAAYREYIGWLQEQDVDKAEQFWREELQGISGPTGVWSELERRERAGQGQVGEYEQRGLRLDEETTRRMEELARGQQVTLNTAVQGAWGVLLSRYSGERDVVFGATVSGRSAGVEGIEGMVGLFINTMPVRVHVEGGEKTGEYLKRLQARQVEAREYEYTPLVKMQGWSETAPGIPLFEHILVFENYPVDTALEERAADELNINEVRSFDQAHYPLVLGISHGREILFRCRYDRHLLEGPTVERLLNHLRMLLEAMIESPEKRLSELSLLTVSEREQLYSDWSDARKKFPCECIHRLFEQQAARTPERFAVVHGEQSLTYAELNRYANRLARYLGRLGATAETRIALCLDRSLEMVVAILGVLKTGAAYLPLDPAYPLERLHFMLEDSEALLILTVEDFREQIESKVLHKEKIVLLDSHREAIEQESDQNLENAVDPDNSAYIIYTSGSTGNPKGTVIPHSNISRLMKATEECFSFDQSDVWTLFHSYAFDFSVWEIWGALVHGGKLVVVPYWTSRTPQDFYELLVREQVTVLNLTPSAFRQFMEAEASSGNADGLKLRLVIFGGEALDYGMLRPWLARHRSQPRLVNMYGITETTVHVTCKLVEQSEIEDGRASLIGSNIPDLTLYVLDPWMEPVPVGVRAELYVGGAGLARCYWRRPDLTAQRFVPNPFAGSVGERLYRTGDVVRWRSAKELEYLGRADQQVKIHGFRIELGEIQAQVEAYPQVHQAVVIAREDDPGEKRLVAYVVARPESININSEELRLHLLERLPEYMVPSAFVSIPSLPLNVNGKLDRKALPAPERMRTTYVPPTTEDERVMCGLWETVLRAERVGMEDNFFEIGGHSLLATQLVSRIKETFAVNVPLRALFEAPTVRRITERVYALKAAATESGDVFVSSVQQDSPMEQILRGLENLSEEEVQALLGADGSAN